MKNLIFTIWLTVLAVSINIDSVDGQWASIGPNGVPIVASDSYENRLFVATEDYAVFRSLDNGVNWKLVYIVPYPDFFFISAIEVTSTYVFINIGWGVVRSTNNGDTWNYLPVPLTSPLNILKSISEILYLGNSEGLYKSTNNGENWTQTGGFYIPNIGSSISDIVSDGSYIFVSDNYGIIYRGSSNGTNWSVVLDSLEVLNIAKLESNESYLFASAWGKGMLRSSDNGNTWEYSNNGLTNLFITSFKYSNSKLFAATNDGVFLTQDNGNNWIHVNNGLPQNAANNLFTGDGVLFVGCYSNGIYKTSDNGNYWSQSNSGFTGHTITSITSNSQFLFVGTRQGELYRSSNLGVDWTSINNGIENKFDVSLLVRDNFVFCGTSGSSGSGMDNLFRSSNNGDTWELIGNGLTYPPKCFAVANTNIFVGTIGGVYFSSNNGDNWFEKNNGLPGQRDIASIIFAGGYFYVGFYSGGIGDFIYRSSDNGDNWSIKINGFQGSLRSFSASENYIFAAGSNGIFRSSDNGDNWIPHNKGFLGLNALSIYASEYYVLASNNSGFFYSEDNGINWYQDNDGFNSNKNILHIYPLQDQIFAGLSSESVWKRNISVLPVELASFISLVIENNVTLSWQTTRETNNSGFDIERSAIDDQWTKAGFVQGNGNSIEPKEYSFTDKNLATGKYTYRLKQIDFNGNYEYFNLTGEVNIGVPNKYELTQNYPNPFNPSTAIRYSLVENGFTSLKVYDITGKEVAKLINEKQDAGRYEVTFNGSNFASGVYFYELRSGSFVSQKRMVLLK